MEASFGKRGIPIATPRFPEMVSNNCSDAIAPGNFEECVHAVADRLLHPCSSASKCT
jgi:hypothetical protein